MQFRVSETNGDDGKSTGPLVFTWMVNSDGAFMMPDVLTTMLFQQSR